MGALEVHAVPGIHSGGSVALFLKGDRGTIVYSGDTGPADAVVEEINRRGKGMGGGSSGVFLAELVVSSCEEKRPPYTGQPCSGDPKDSKNDVVPIFAYHLKAPYQDELVRELKAIGDSRIRVLEPGMTIEF